jgi:erythronate-4-phosphate dehydrogenase
LDHLDVQWLDLTAVKWGTAYGANATAVVEYVLATVAALQKMAILPSKPFRAGVIGVGNIGSKVVEKLLTLGCEVVQCDPVRALTDKNFISTPMEEFSDLDFITLHTPLTHGGDFATYHMIDQAFLQRQKPQCVLLNSGRGAVIDFAALKAHGRHLHWCLDVWENEPEIDAQVLDFAILATPHIAGYTMQSKYRGIDMVYRAACEQKVSAPLTTTTVEFPSRTFTFSDAKIDWRDVVLKIYDPRQTTAEMKTTQAKTFDNMRKHFKNRNEFAYVRLAGACVSNSDSQLLKLLGFVNLA